jgi:hypothetical protein
MRQPFDESVAVRGDAVILRHVLEHVDDPLTFLRNIRTANGGKGRIYIEVPCLDWIRDHRAWFDIYYEHVNYFRLADFHRIFGRVHEAGRLFGEEYLYIVADLESLGEPSGDFETFDLPEDFLAHAERLTADLAGRGDEPLAICGGASKGVNFSLLMQRAGVDVDMVIDMNPAKQGLYLAGTGLMVHSPEEAMERLPPGADILVMKRNYLAEVKAFTGGRFRYGTVDHE